jgi:Tfp pilus assembly protein FimT
VIEMKTVILYAISISNIRGHMKQQLRSIITVSLAIVLCLPITAGALEGSEYIETNKDASTTSKARPTTEELREKVRSQKESAKAQLAEARSEARQKLTDAKRKACESHKSRINTTMGNMDSRRQRAYDHITKVYDAVEQYITDKNITVESYDELITSITNAKTAASEAMIAQQQAPELDCAGEQPRADIADFRLKRLSSIDAMQTYRQAVKDLISATKAAVKTGDAS